MDRALKSRLDMVAVWSGFAGLMLFGIGWAFVGGFVFPIHAPSATAQEIAALYRPRLDGIRIGMILVMFSALLTMPFSALIVKVISRIEGEVGLLSVTAILGGAAQMVLGFYPAMWWLLAAFRPDRSPDLIQLVNDAAWLQLIGGVAIFLAMPLSMAVAAFCDTSAEPVFPRWSAYVNIWAAFLLLPDQLVFIFKRGIFAWNGLVGFYLPLLAFCGWYLVALVLLRRGIGRELSSGGTARPMAGAVDATP